MTCSSVIPPNLESSAFFLLGLDSSAAPSSDGPPAPSSAAGGLFDLGIAAMDSEYTPVFTNNYSQSRLPINGRWTLAQTGAVQDATAVLLPRSWDRVVHDKRSDWKRDIL